MDESLDLSQVKKMEVRAGEVGVVGWVGRMGGVYEQEVKWDSIQR